MRSIACALLALSIAGISETAAQCNWHGFSCYGSCDQGETCISVGGPACMCRWGGLEAEEAEEAEGDLAVSSSTLNQSPALSTCSFSNNVCSGTCNDGTPCTGWPAATCGMNCPFREAKGNREAEAKGNREAEEAKGDLAVSSSTLNQSPALSTCSFSTSVCTGFCGDGSPCLGSDTGSCGMNCPSALDVDQRTTNAIYHANGPTKLQAVIAPRNSADPRNSAQGAGACATILPANKTGSASGPHLRAARTAREPLDPSANLNLTANLTDYQSCSIDQCATCYDACYNIYGVANYCCQAYDSGIKAHCCCFPTPSPCAALPSCQVNTC